MTEINNRIDASAIARIIIQGGFVKKQTPFYKVVGVARQIRQLFTQPLDKELREKIENLEDILFCAFEAYQAEDILSGEMLCFVDDCNDQILALLQPKIEEARKEGYKLGVEHQYKASRMDIKEAKREERERMVQVGDALLGDVYWRGKFSTGEIRQFWEQLKGLALKGGE